MSLLKTMFKDQARGLMVGLFSILYVLTIFCGCLLLPMWVSRVTDGGIWGLIVGAVLFSVMLFVAPALGAGFVIHRRNRALDDALTPLGLQGRALDIVWREYHGEVEGRAVTARFYRGPSFELGVSVPAQTRAAISRAAVVIPQLARAFNYQPLTFAESELADLSISGPDEVWLRGIISINRGSGRSPDRARCGSVGRPATAPQLIEKIRCGRCWLRRTCGRRSRGSCWRRMTGPRFNRSSSVRRW